MNNEKFARDDILTGVPAFSLTTWSLDHSPGRDMLSSLLSLSPTKAFVKYKWLYKLS